MARGAKTPQEAVEAIAYGDAVDDGSGGPNESDVRAALAPHTAAAIARIDGARTTRVTDRERGAYPVTLYNDSSDRTMVVTDDFAGPVEKYRAERLSGVARGSGDAMYLVMVDMGCKRIDAARAAYKRRQRRAA